MQLHRDYLGVGELVPSRPGLPFWASGSGMGAGAECGIGDLVPSNPGLPFWPSGAGMGDLVPSAPGRPFWPSGSGMGDRVPTSAMYPIPQNSVLEHWGLGDCGCGCGGGCHSHGMGALTDDFGAMFSNLTQGNFSGAWSSFMSAMQEPVFGTLPFWMVGGGALLAYAFFFSGGAKHSRYQRARRAIGSARAAYA